MPLRNDNEAEDEYDFYHESRYTMAVLDHWAPVQEGKGAFLDHWGYVRKERGIFLNYSEERGKDLLDES